MNRKSQVVIETAMVIVVLAIFLIGVTRIWVWFVNTYSDRWRSYDNSRVQAGKISSDFIPDGYNKTANRLNLFR